MNQSVRKAEKLVACAKSGKPACRSGMPKREYPRGLAKTTARATLRQRNQRNDRAARTTRI